MHNFSKTKIFENHLNIAKNPLIIWLTTCLLLILLIIFIGGLTRLTNSGLSIVEWKPITGIIPPINIEEWEMTFKKYQQFPEYKYLNSDMKLAEFKKIYYIEYFHRLLGRIITIVFLIPLIYFLVKNFIPSKSKKYFLLATFMLFLQGVVGWYMVKSGLLRSYHISHYRLALHFTIAVIIYSVLFWQLITINNEILLITKNISLYRAKIACFFSLIITYIQIILGALLAGLKGGHVYNTFPLMGNYYIPTEIRDSSLFQLVLLNDAVFVQFYHRINGYILTLSIIILIYFLFETQINKLRKLGLMVLLVTGIQLILGILTLLYLVPLLLGLLHQIGSIVLLSFLLYCYFLLSTKQENTQ